MTDQPARAYDTMSSILVESLLGDDGEPPCKPPDDCEVCCLFSARRPNETAREWGGRLERTSWANHYRRIMG